jgi:hypothetical protein
MSDFGAFQEQGKTVAINPSGTSQNAQIVTRGGMTPRAIKIFNNSNQVCYVAFGSDSSVTASVPSTSTPAYGMTLAMGEDAVFINPRGAPQCWVAVIAAGAATGNINFTPGEGR